LVFQENLWSRRCSSSSSTSLWNFALFMLGKSKGENIGEISNNENWAEPHKGMTPPSTQNLKALGLWVFFLICCSTFPFLLNVGLRLTLGFLTISSSSESPSSTVIHPHRAKATPYLYHHSHIYTGHACLKPPSRRLLIQGQTEPIRLMKKMNHRLW